MAGIIRFGPPRDLVANSGSMDRLFDEALVGSVGLCGPVDMYQVDDDAVRKATLPGAAATDTSISVAGDVLTIRGEVKSDREVYRREYHLRERRHGGLTRTFALPTRLRPRRRMPESRIEP